MNDLFISSIKAFVSFCVQFQYTGKRVISLGALGFSANITVDQKKKITKTLRDYAFKTFRK